MLGEAQVWRLPAMSGTGNTLCDDLPNIESLVNFVIQLIMSLVDTVTRTRRQADILTFVPTGERHVEHSRYTLPFSLDHFAETFETCVWPIPIYDYRDRHCGLSSSR